MPTTVTTDPSGLDLQHVTKYDQNGNVTATIMPANPTGGDAHETDTTYYRASTGSGVAACDSKPQFAGHGLSNSARRTARRRPPRHPHHTYTYDMWGDTLTRTDTSGTTTRTWTYTYDAAGRPSTTAVAGPGTSLPTVTQNYDAATGLPSTTTDGTNTITRAYDNLGRPKTYTDPSGNQSTYTYDIMNRVATLNDGKGTQTYTYQATSDERGLLTSISDTAAGTFTGTYDADGNLTDQHLPTGSTSARRTTQRSANRTALPDRGLLRIQRHIPPARLHRPGQRPRPMAHVQRPQFYRELRQRGLRLRRRRAHYPSPRHPRRTMHHPPIRVRSQTPTEPNTPPPDPGTGGACQTGSPRHGPHLRHR